MSIGITISLSGISLDSPKKINREHKGKSLIEFPSDYVVIDIETTGLDPYYDEIIEVAALKISNGAIIDTYQTLVKPTDIESVNEYITQLTGITPKMLSNAPLFTDIKNDFLSFLNDSILVGHNVNFDINFLYDATNGSLRNDFIDTMRISRRLLPELKHHRLKDIAVHYNVDIDKSHRALDDCKTTNTCYMALYSNVLTKFDSPETFYNSVKKYHLNANDIKTNNIEFDVNHPLYNKACVFTGTLERFPRKEAMQLVADVGGICQNGINAKTNYLILGNNDYCSTIKDGKSSKQKKAEELKLAGKDIEIISENVFYDMFESHEI